MSLSVNVLREEPVQQVCRQFFYLGDLGRYKPHGSFPSLALLSQDAEETQEESLKAEVTSGPPAAESQVGWVFLSFSWTCCLVFKAVTRLFFFFFFFFLE